MALIAQFLFGLSIALLLVYIFKIMLSRRKLIAAIERLPGPPNITWAPVLNHALVIVYLDSLRHRMGTFALTYHVLSNMRRLFPDTGICRFWLAWKPVVMLYAPETIEPILVSTSVINKADEYRFFEPWIGEGLVTSKQNKWRFRRKILTPAFHFRILNDFLPIINAEAGKLVDKLKQNGPTTRNNSGERTCVDITPLITLCTLDTICETAMGVNINCQADGESEYVKCLYEVGEMALSRVTRPWLWFDWVFALSSTGRRFSRAKRVMHNFTERVIRERKTSWLEELNRLDSQAIKVDQKDDEASTVGQSANSTQANSLTIDELRASSFFSSGNKRLAFLDLLLHQHIVERTMTIDDVREEVDTFMFAGHDTTAMSISWTIYMLGLHEDIQRRARDELDSIVGLDKNKLCGDREQTAGADLSSDQLRQMKYLDRVIKESLRMWPSIPFVARQMTDDISVGAPEDKYLIPKGATCMIFTHVLHNNPKYYPKPEIFDPDRFLLENCNSRHPFAYIPFSAGPRNCIGQKFAQIELKVILAKLLLNFHFVTCDQIDKLAVIGELVLRSRNGLRVKILPRFQANKAS